MQETVDEPRSPSVTMGYETPTPSPRKMMANSELLLATARYRSPGRRKMDASSVDLESPKTATTAVVNASSSSTKVIESLHEQIDTLTSTNLQLTLQSHTLLDKLENAQQRESKLQESLSSLKNENENLNSILNRKTRKLKDFEQQISDLQQKCDSVSQEKTEIQDKYSNVFSNEQKLQQEIEMIKTQYDAVLEAQTDYKAHYMKEIDTLKEQLESYVKDQETLWRNMQGEHTHIDEKLDTINKKFYDIKAANATALQLLQNSCQDVIATLDLPQWIKLYRESKKMVYDYAEKMKLDIPKDFVNELQDGISTQFQVSKLRNNFTNPAPTSPYKNSSTGFGDIASRKGSNNNNSNNSSRKSSHHLDNMHGKRSTFYGGTTTTGQIPHKGGLGLPGVKRSSSIRKSTLRTPSGNGDSPRNSPKLSSSRNGFH